MDVLPYKVMQVTHRVCFENETSRVKGVVLEVEKWDG